MNYAHEKSSVHSFQAFTIQIKHIFNHKIAYKFYQNLNFKCLKNKKIKF